MGAEAGPYRAFFLGKGSKSSQLLYGWLGVTTSCGLVSVSCCDTLLDLSDDELWPVDCVPSVPSPAVCVSFFWLRASCMCIVRRIAGDLQFEIGTSGRPCILFIDDTDNL
jgi:hypothetical protein